MNVNAVKPLTDVAELVSRLRSLMIMNQCVSACDSRVRVHTVMLIHTNNMYIKDIHIEAEAFYRNILHLQIL